MRGGKGSQDKALGTWDGIFSACLGRKGTGDCLVLRVPWILTCVSYGWIPQANFQCVVVSRDKQHWLQVLGKQNKKQDFVWQSQVKRGLNKMEAGPGAGGSFSKFSALYSYVRSLCLLSMPRRWLRALTQQEKVRHLLYRWAVPRTSALSLRCTPNSIKTFWSMFYSVENPGPRIL